METRKSAMRTRSHSLVNAANGPQNGQTGTRTRHKSGNASYADLITRAILSSDEKRLTLSEIYDWMVDNVPGLKDQRYLHSAKGWKNAVRHTLSINPRFRKLARLGRPGWWTVDPDFVSRSAAASAGVVPPPAPPVPAPSFTTTALIWDAQSGPQSQAFRGRLSSAPALFLSPVAGFSPGSMGSRPPSSVSMSTPVASPASPPPPETGTQTVHVWQEQGGVGLLAVPRPLPVRMASLSETGTQTDRPPDHLDNISPATSPFHQQALISNNCHQRQDQTGQARVRVSLSQCADGRPILIVTNTTVSSRSIDQVQQMVDPCTLSPSDYVHKQQLEHQFQSGMDANMASISDHHFDTYHITDLSDQKPISAISSPLETLPEDLEGINVDPSVGCDVVAVIKYEQNMGRCNTMGMPYLEPILETSN